MLSFMCDSANDLRILAANRSEYVILCRRNMPINTWTHVAITMSASGNVCYYNGVPDGVYSTGSAATVFDLSNPLVKPDYVIVGADIGNYTTTPPEVRQYIIPVTGQVSDVMLWNRALSPEEMLSIYNDNLEYNVICLAGQSNMISRAAGVAGIDDQYDSLLGKVYHYKTSDNISNWSSNATVTNTDHTTAISIVNEPLRFPDASANFSANSWLPMISKLINEVRVPFRKKWLLVPVARGGSGFSINIGIQGILFSTLLKLLSRKS